MALCRKHTPAFQFAAMIIAVTVSFCPFDLTLAEEGLGSLEFSDLLLEPSYTVQEPNRGRFSPGLSYLAATWTRDRLISAVFKVGSRDLIGVPARYGPAVVDQIGVVEAYAQADSEYGRVRFGLVPIPFGLEGGDAERRLRFPRSLIHQTRYLNIRDYGFAYQISENGFFSDWAAHNGEGGTDLDNEVWLTSRIGWQGGRFFRIGVSGQTGRTSPRSTNPLGASSSTAAGLDVDKIARFRIVNGFVDWEDGAFRFEAEATAGDATQDSNVIKTRAVRVDLEYRAKEHASLLARYDTIDPRNDVGGDQVTEASLGGAWRSRYDNSVLYVIGTKKIRQDVPQDEHRGMIMWRIQPSALSFQSAL